MRLSRRSLLLSGLGAAGALVVGWSALPPRSRLGGPDTMPPREGQVGLNGWIKVEEPGYALLAIHYAEMGQGVDIVLIPLLSCRRHSYIMCTWS